MFQFPTGWNSTQSLDLSCEHRNCFNSQRDGILPQSILWERRRFSVSIPNGMEFYSQSLISQWQSDRFQFPTGWNSTDVPMFASDNPIRFNSQRDGILLSLIPVIAFPRGFQFPTGWNSTKPRRSYGRARQIVSIPNGMEFYTRHLAASKACEKVSIPDGMEFYERG